MKCYIKKQLTQGSALILTILLITAISTVLFSVARLTFSDLAQATRLEESITANYAAESGVELGLLAYRLNQESEMSTDATSATDESLSFDLKDDSASIISAASASISPSVPSALMRMWWKEAILGNVAYGEVDLTKENPKLYKDQTIELDLTNLQDQTLTFYWTSAKILASLNVPGASNCEEGKDCDYPRVKPMDCLDENNHNDDKCYFIDSGQPIRVKGPYGLEFTLSTVDINGAVEECDKKFFQNTLSVNLSDSNYTDNSLLNLLSWQCQPNRQTQTDDITKYKLRIKPYIGILDDPERADDRPYVYYAVSPIENMPIDNGTTYITSTGVYGSTRRTLTIDINRSSTKLLGLYDLLLGGLGGEVTGPTASPSPSPSESPSPTITPTPSPTTTPTP